ncbi:MAG: hypothetical protein ACYTBS_09705 [Planctomycetota bacterium]|jgi:ATP-dependent RNA helicase SUPV3L1/SUV3
MKQSGKSNLFALVCIAVLLAAYGVGLGVKKVRFAAVAEKAPTDVEPEEKADVSEDKVVAAGETLEPKPSEEVAGEPAEEPAEEFAARPQRREGGRRGMMGEGMRERFQNMSEEERQEAMAQMRERFGGRRRGEDGGGGPFGQMSEEDREQFRADMEELRNRAEEMSDEEREQARNEIFEKYGITPGRFGGRRGGRGPGGEE